MRTSKQGKTKAMMAAVLFGGMAATSLPSGAIAGDWESSPYLFGNWGGERTTLADDGVTFDFGYLSEPAHSLSGGTRHLTVYNDMWSGGVTVNLDKALHWKGATFRIFVTDRNGGDLGSEAHIGNNQLISEVYGRGETWYLSEFSLDQKLLHDRLELKVGRMMIGTDFATFSCDFQNLTFCGAQPGNIVGTYWLNIPISVWAALVKYNITPTVYFKVGGYQVSPNYTDMQYGESHGLLPVVPGDTTGALLPAELGWTPTFRGLPGSWVVGGWYNTSREADIYYNTDREDLATDGGVPLEHNGAYGGFVTVQQQLSGEAGGRGLSLFTNLSMADRRSSETNGQVNLGLEYKGAFQRPADMIGFGIGATHINTPWARYMQAYNALHPAPGDAVGAGYEYASELFYSWSPIASVQLRPNVQYIIHPDGTTQNANAWVIGLKTLIAF